jgi:hypothetical protein
MAEQRPKAMPIVPTKKPNHCGFVPGDGGAKIKSKSEPMGQMPVEIAHIIPRVRSEMGRIPLSRSARAS